MGMEQEIKLRARDGADPSLLPEDPALLPLRCSPMESIEMRTTYYDTEDGLLEKNRWMLRLRTENERSVVTMKTPGEGHTRGEWEVESEYLDEALPALAKLGAPEAIGRLDAEALLPVCGAKFTRITAPLRLSEKTSCTLCGDLGELTGGGKKELLCELELELQAGEEADVQAFAKTLAERFHLHEQPRSKLQRARALTQ